MNNRNSDSVGSQIQADFINSARLICFAIAHTISRHSYNNTQSAQIEPKQDTEGGRKTLENVMEICFFFFHTHILAGNNSYLHAHM